MVQRLIVAAFFVLSMLPTLGQQVNGEATYISFSVPGAQGTYPMSINASMTVTGYYFVSPGVTRGFVRDPDGTITTFTVKGAIWMEPESINAAGDLTGFYEINAGIPKGFLRHADGTIITFDPPPNDPHLTPAQALPVGINEFDEIVGSYPAPLVAPKGFTRSRAGEYSTFGFAYDYSTVPTSINASGAVVGYFDYDSGEAGFVEHPNGYWEMIFVPPVDQDCSGFTIPEAINAEGTVAGWYLSYSDHCTTESTWGFVRSPEGVMTTFTLSGILPTLPLPGLPIEANQSLTVAHWISLDDNGDIAGSYKDASGFQHGFVRNPYGTITTFDPSESKQTTSTSINNLGEVAGYYSYKAGSGVPLGFIRIPKS